MTHSQEREQRKLAYYAEPQNEALKKSIRHILGISGGKDSATLYIGNPSVTSRQSAGGSHSSILLRGFYNPFCLGKK